EPTLKIQSDRLAHDSEVLVVDGKSEVRRGFIGGINRGTAEHLCSASRDERETDYSQRHNQEFAAHSSPLLSGELCGLILIRQPRNRLFARTNEERRDG